MACAVKVTFKMYASLAQYLPADAEQNTVTVDIPADLSVHGVLDRFKVPREAAHLLLVNGIYIEPEDRDHRTLAEGDALAIWPPVAGG